MNKKLGVEIKMKLLIAGDLVPTKTNIDLFNNASVDSLLGEELLSIWNSADIRIFNLETPITDIENPIDKWGPNLIAPTSTINGIKALKPSLITLANNHILDQGVQGLNSTQELLTKNAIPYLGVGKNVIEASKPYIISRDGFKVGIYACAEHEFSIATSNAPGANPFDSLNSLDHIQDLKTQCDYVIVLYHGGKEHYRYPSPYLQKVCRKMAQKGANLIVCQHSHCIGCYEEYNESTIVYGQGNFIFNKRDNEYWNTGLLINIELKNGGIKFIPITKSEYGTQLATGQAKKDILDAFQLRSKEILKENFIEHKYLEFARKNIDLYLRQFSGFGKWLSRIDRYLLNGKLINSKYKRKELLAIQNYIECEAHRELLLQGLEDKARADQNE